MDMPQYSSNIDVHNTSSRTRPTSLNPLVLTSGTAQPPSRDQSISSQSELSNSNGSISSDTQPQVTQEQFADIVIKADSKIPRTKMKDIKYLCHDKVRDQHVLEEAKSAKDIFQDMNVSGKLTRENIILISELFHRMGMLKDKSNLFKGTKIEWNTGMPSTLDEFRCLMYSIAEQIPSSDLKKMKDFCLDQELLEPYQLEDSQNFLDFFMLLEDEAVIEADNIGLLKDFTKLLNIHKVKELVDKYEEQKIIQKQPVLTMTVEDSKRLMTFRTLSLIEDLSTVHDIIGSEEYQKLIQIWQDEKEKKLSGATSHKKRHSSLAKMSAGLVTPSMLTGDGEANLEGKRNWDFAPSSDQRLAPDSLKGRDFKPSQDRDVQHRSLKSKDSERADSNSEGEGGEDTLSVEVENEPYTTTHQTLHQRRYRIYPMDKNPKGICLIISNKKFDDEKVQQRSGTEKDVENLRNTFGKKLNFKVHVEKDLTAAEMLKELKKWRDHDHSAYNAFVCCLLSHGNRGVVIGTDGRPLQLSDAMGCFKGNCPSLIDKPKIFIVQACQGDSWQGFTNQQVPNSPTGEPVGMGSIHTPQLPNEADFVLLLATVPGFKSARSSKKGSWFIMALTKILQTHVDIEIHSAMTLLNYELSKVRDAKMDGKEVSQTAFPCNTLRKMLFLQQPVDCPPRV